MSRAIIPARLKPILRRGGDTMDTTLTAIETTDTIDEATWLYAASRNPAFTSLADASEDIYSRDDGKPFKPES